MSKSMDIVMKLQAKIDKQLPKSLKMVSNEISLLTKRQKELKSAEKLGDKFQKSKTQLVETIKLYRLQRNELRVLQQAKNAGIALSKKEEARYASLGKSIDRLNSKMGSQKTAYQRTKMELQKLKLPLSDLREEYLKNERALKKLNIQQRITSKVTNIKTRVGGAVKTGAKAVGRAAVVGGTVATLAIGYGAAQSARAYTEFNGQMKRVQAISGATKEEFITLEKEAMRLGATTKFTSSEAAAGMEKMALAGFSTNQILQSMPGVLDLSAASGEDLALVSDIMTDNLVPFNMTAEDTGRMADILAYTMSKTNVTVGMLGESFKYVSGSANTLGVNLEETTAALGLMGDQAIKSGQAGRGLDATFGKLAKNASALKKIGIDIKKDNGDFVGITSVVEQFEKKLAGMGNVDKSAFLQDALGKQGAVAFGKLLTTQKTINGVIYKGSQALKQQILATTNDSIGSAEKMKNIMLEGAAGTKILFDSAFDGVKIAIGKQLLSETVLVHVRKVTTYLGELANVINGTFSEEPANKFWRNVIGTAKKFISDFKEAMRPGVEAIRKIFPSDTSGMFSGFVNGLLNLVVTITKIVSSILIVFSPIIRFIVYVLGKVGVENILIFIGAFMAIKKILAVVTVITTIISTVSALGGILATIPVVLGAIKIAMLAMGGPIVWIGALLVALVFIIYKNWEKIKNTFMKFPELFGFILGPLWVLGVTIYKNWEAIKTWTSNLVSTLVNLFYSCIEKIKFFIMGLWEKAKEIFSKFPEVLVFILGPLGLIIGTGIRIYKNWDLIKAKGLELKDSLVATFTSIGQGIKGAFTGVIDFVSGIFTGISTKFAEIKEMIKLPEPPEWMLKIGAKVSSIRTPTTATVVDGSHKNGLGEVPFDGYIAELHKGERVLTSDENNSLMNKAINATPMKETKTQNNSKKIPSIVLNPIINIQGNADSGIIEELKKEMEILKENLRKMIKEIMDEEGRTAF